MRCSHRGPRLPSDVVWSSRRSKTRDYHSVLVRSAARTVGKEKRHCHEDLIVTPREKRERTAQLRAARSTKGATPKSPCGISCSPPHAAATPTQSHTPAGIHCFQEFLQRGSRLGRWPGRSLWHCCFVLKQDSQRSSMAGKAFC